MTAVPTSRLRLLAAWAVLCLIWGSTWLVIKLGLAVLPPLWFVAFRFLLATSLLFAFCLGRFPLLPRHRSDYAFLALTGLLIFGFNYGTLFWGEQHVSSGLAAVLQAMIPIFGMVFAHIHIPGERLHPLKLLGAFLGLFGVGLICSKVLDVQGPLALWGGLAIVAGGAAAAYASVLVKLRGGQFAPAVLAAWQMLFGCIPLALLAFWEEGSPLALHWTAAAVGCVLYLAVLGSAVAFLVYYWLMQRMEVTKVQTISLITPPLAVLLGWLLAAEQLSPWALLGGAFILAGMSFIFWKLPAAGAPAATAAGDPAKVPLAPA